MLTPEALDALGWFSAACFSLCSLPQLILTVKLGHARSVSLAFLLLWLVGEIGMFCFMHLSGALKIQLLCNYIFNIVGISVILWYKWFPRRDKSSKSVKASMSEKPLPFID